MDNRILGKTLKAMYKLSGKTLPQLSEETGLTIDTINNLFYARVQKPGLSGVIALVDSMGFSLQQLMTFIEENPEIPDDCNTTELFTEFISAADDTIAPVQPAKFNANRTTQNIPEEIKLLNIEHEKQLDRFRATHQRYVDQLKEQHENQIEQMREHNRKMEQHYDNSVSALNSLHKQEIERFEYTNTRLRKTIRLLGAAIGIETGLILILLIFDMFNRSIGWLH